MAGNGQNSAVLAEEEELSSEDVDVEAMALVAKTSIMRVKHALGEDVGGESFFSSHVKKADTVLEIMILYRNSLPTNSAIERRAISKAVRLAKNLDDAKTILSAIVVGTECEVIAIRGLAKFFTKREG